MFVFFATLIALSAWAVAASIVGVARDGYRRRPTRDPATAHQDVHADHDRERP
ncbi:hypothetical protein [Compostimonas suwonensis]|uniref:Uncharacterized protein n=1 Tax=Compostimonas suwonensis TaxID=1048394 RepID=A0A2M9C4S4_9MICO|nr:hypothetical protein [Compostimonas suwonensis]PJJ65516.1 hypothetical protein CLV54_0549 [Compostimonas suwonensis]